MMLFLSKKHLQVPVAKTNKKRESEQGLNKNLSSKSKMLLAHADSFTDRKQRPRQHDHVPINELEQLQTAAIQNANRKKDLEGMLSTGVLPSPHNTQRTPKTALLHYQISKIATCNPQWS